MQSTPPPWALGGTCELEGRAMLATLVRASRGAAMRWSIPPPGRGSEQDDAYSVDDQAEFEEILEAVKVDAGLLIAPDGLQPRFLEILEHNTVNLGCSPDAARVCADKLLCTQVLARAGVPVAEIVDKPDPARRAAIATW